MSEDPAEFLARRIRQEHNISENATHKQLEGVCRQRGVKVRRRSITRRGYYCDDPYALIVLDRTSLPHITAHELYHHIIKDNESHGITYSGPDWVVDHPEEAARRFERLMCGEEGQQN